jgi:hypothetical protein
MAVQVFSGTVTNGTPQSGLVQALPAESKSLGVAVLSQYSATAATTGVQLQVGASIDGGATFSDYAIIATTAPTPSSGSPVQSEVYASLDTYKGATHLQFKLVNLDASNIATVTLTFRAAA